MADNGKWVQCDKCDKWRLLPLHVDTKNLPKEWYCEMNVYDKLRNRCNVPEQTFDSQTSEIVSTPKKLITKASKVSKLKTTKKHKLPTVLDESSEESDQSDSSKSADEEDEDETPKANTNENPSLSSGFKKAKNRGSLRSKRKSGWICCLDCNKWRSVPRKIPMKSLPIEWSCDMNHWNPSLANCKAPLEEKFFGTKEGQSDKYSDKRSELRQATPRGRGRGRGRGRKRGRGALNSGRATSKTPLSNSNSITSVGTITVDQLNWVQCDKCSKWRTLPAYVNTDLLPDRWFCQMNAWNPKVRSCAAPDEADKPSNSHLTQAQYTMHKDIEEHNKSIIEGTKIKGDLVTNNIKFSEKPPNNFPKSTPKLEARRSSNSSTLSTSSNLKKKPASVGIGIGIGSRGKPGRPRYYNMWQQNENRKNGERSWREIVFGEGRPKRGKAAIQKHPVALIVKDTQGQHVVSSPLEFVTKVQASLPSVPNEPIQQPDPFHEPSKEDAESLVSHWTSKADGLFGRANTELQYYSPMADTTSELHSIARMEMLLAKSSQYQVPKITPQESKR